MARRTAVLVGVLAGAIATAVVAGIAWAAIPGADGVIQGCYDHGGNLKVVSALPCPKNWTPLAWNQQGVPGKDGADGTNGTNGADGKDGEPGPPGPSASFTNYGDGVHTIGAGLTQTVAGVTIPAGSYVLTGALQSVGDDGTEFAQCFFDSPGADALHGRFAVMTSNGHASILGDVTVSNATNDVTLRCNSQGGESEVAGQMIATKVGTVTNQS